MTPASKTPVSEIPVNGFFLSHGELFAVIYIHSDTVICKQIANARLEYTNYQQNVHFKPEFLVDRVSITLA